MTLGAALATAVACYLLRPDDGLILRLRLGRTGRDRVGLPPAGGPMVFAVLGTVLVSVAVPNTATQVACVAFVAVGVFAGHVRRCAMARQRAVEFRGEVSRVINSVAAELRAGVEPSSAIRAAVADASANWEPVRTAALGDMAQVLRAMSSRPGGEGLAEVAAAWHVAEQTGSPLATVLDRMAASVLAEVELDRDVAAEAAPARATARLMALLPLAGLGLGMLLGANPVRVLLTSGVGVGCLVAGLTLACLGVWRIERIVAEVEVR